MQSTVAISSFIEKPASQSSKVSASGSSLTFTVPPQPAAASASAPTVASIAAVTIWRFMRSLYGARLTHG